MVPAAGRGKQLPSGRAGSASYCTWQHRPSTYTCVPFLCQNASSALFLVQLHLPEVRWMGNIVEWNSPEFSSKTSMPQLYLKKVLKMSSSCWGQRTVDQSNRTSEIRRAAIQWVVQIQPSSFHGKTKLKELEAPDCWASSFATGAAYELPALWTVKHFLRNYGHEFSYEVTDTWYFQAAVKKSLINSTARFGTDKSGEQCDGTREFRSLKSAYSFFQIYFALVLCLIQLWHHTLSLTWCDININIIM